VCFAGISLGGQKQMLFFSHPLVLTTLKQGTRGMGPETYALDNSSRLDAILNTLIFLVREVRYIFHLSFFSNHSKMKT